MIDSNCTLKNAERSNEKEKYILVEWTRCAAGYDLSKFKEEDDEQLSGAGEVQAGQVGVAFFVGIGIGIGVLGLLYKTQVRLR